MTEGKPRGENWHRRGIGGKWEKIGKLQFEFLVDRGLKPKDYLLDIGCGSLRGGVHFIRYLETGHYYGIDKEESLLEAGTNIELKRYNIDHKNPHLLLIDDFDLSRIPQDIQFDFMLAQSVFTHLMPDMIELCLTRVMPRLKPTGEFYATFWRKGGEFDFGEPHPWRKNERKGTRYPLSFFRRLAKQTGVSVEYYGDWGHPRNQEMLGFRRS